MDKEYDERMAPALHTSDHEPTGTLITSLKYPSCNQHVDHIEEDVMKQLNGINSNDVAQSVNSNQYYYKLESVPSSLSYGNYGEGDNRILSKLDLGSDPTKGKLHSAKNLVHFGSGDASIQQRFSVAGENNSNNWKKTKELENVPNFTGSDNDDYLSVLHKHNNSSKDTFDTTLPTSQNSDLSLAALSSTCTTHKNVNKMSTGNHEPLVVNVDKQNSINLQIIHTTSITTSPLSTACPPDLDQKENNGSSCKQSVVSFECKNANFQSTLDSAKSSESYKPSSHGKYLVASRPNISNSDEKLAHHNVDGLTIESNSHELKNRDSSTENELSFSVNGKCFSQYPNVSDTEAEQSEHLHSNNSSSSSHVKQPLLSCSSSCNSPEFFNTLSKGNVNHKTLNVLDIETSSDIKLEDHQLKSSKNASDSTQATLSLLTQTTPVYNFKQSISASCIQEPSSTTSNDSYESEAGDHIMKTLPDLKNLADQIFNGKNMEKLPLKVTNTIQELVASLTSKQNTALYTNHVATSNKPCFNSTISTEKDNSLVHCKLPTLKNVEEQLKSQHSDVIKCKAELDERLCLLQLRLNRLRAASVIHHTQKHLPFWKAMRYSNTPSAVEDRVSPLWTNYLPYSNSSPKDFKDVNDNSLPVSDAETPIAQQHARKSQPRNSSKNPPTNFGIWKKELTSAKKRIDPDLTDSSSEDEAFESHNSNASVSHTVTPIHKTALWDWAQDRVSIAHRWTWLDAQVTGLKFKIKQHQDLQEQLRAAKGKVCLGYPKSPSQSPLISHQVDSQLRCSTCIADNIAHRGFASSPAFTSSRDSRRHHTDRLSEPAFSSSVGNNTTSIISTSSSFSTDSESSAMPERCTPDNDGSNLLCARVRPLKQQIRHRRLLRTADVTALSGKHLKPPTVRNDCEIMRAEQCHNAFHRADGKSRGIAHLSMRNRAAMHDHSYHKILSTTEDLSLSVRLNGVMLTNNKQFAARLRRMERQSEKRNKRKIKEAKQREDRLLEKIKSRPRSATVVLERADKLIRSVSSLHRNTSYEDRSSFDLKKRRSVPSFAEFSKRSRLTSCDSDVESVHNRSESGTPVFDSPAYYYNNPQYQAVLKRKRVNDHAYDINNIVIPHGLASTRIEKLQYKEILTPGWRTTKPEPVRIGTRPVDDQAEDVTDEVFKTRHDRHEILEKKKYMNYLEMNINKRTGSRSMSGANLPLDDSLSFFPPSFRASPFTPPSEIATPPSPDSFSPPLMSRSRRSSSELSMHSNTSGQPVAERIRFHDSLSSDDGLLRKYFRENSNSECWESRTFPLSEQEVEEMKKEPIVCLKKLPKEFESSRLFQPISGHLGSHDGQSAAKSRTFGRSDSISHKRSRTDSHASAVSRDDERQSDDSVSSSRSLHRIRAATGDASHTRVSSPATLSLQSQRKRHKPTHKDDFYYYSEIDSESQSDSDSDSRLATSADQVKGHSEAWVSHESTPKASTSGDETVSPSSKPPLLLKVKKKFLFR